MITITRRRLMGTAAVATAAVGLSGRAFGQNSPDKAAIDQVLRQAAEARRVPGVVAVAATDKGTLYEGAFGTRELPDGPAMTLDTVFWIASMTKAVTSTAAMQLVEQGKLQLDQPISDILPELRAPQVLEGFDASGAPRLRPARRPITLRHLLTHTAGFSYDVWNADIGRYMKQAGVPGVITVRNDALKTPLVFDPGERWEYGINIDWAGKAVEKVSGESLEAYFREHIFAPLGMADTAFRISPSMRERLVSMHARQADGSFRPTEFEIPQEPEFFMGGGGLYSTGPDYLRFCRVFLHEGRLDGAQVLKPETVAMMSRNQMGDIKVGLLKTVQPESSNDAEFFPGMVKRWSTAFMINEEEAPTGRGAGSLAWAGLGNTYFWIDPRRRVTGVILTQLLPFADATVLDLFGQFERGVYKMARAA
jgi:CubicO group peptidase (beta-lactamase class C family)